MAQPFIDISVLGDKALMKALAELPDKAQKQAIQPALKASAKRLKNHVIQKLSGIPIAPLTGRLLVAIIAEKLERLKYGRDYIGSGIPLPRRASLGIELKAEYYYPAYLEYGYDLFVHGRYVKHVAPKSFARSSVDENARRELSSITSKSAKGIEKQFKRLVAGRSTYARAKGRE